MDTKNSKKLNRAKIAYEAYCNLGSLQKTREATGLNINTIRKYITLIEINQQNKISAKDTYYNQTDVNTQEADKDLDIINDTEVTSTNNVSSTRETKNKIILSKLDSISLKYLNYLDDPDNDKLDKTSLKDRAVIAGILLDKKISMEHKQADVIRDQSIIFNLFGNNKNLSKFITDAMTRKKRLADRPRNKYNPNK